jgi:hypothetical protein
MGIDSSLTLLQEGHMVIMRLWIPITTIRRKRQSPSLAIQKTLRLTCTLDRLSMYCQAKPIVRLRSFVQ